MIQDVQVIAIRLRQTGLLLGFEPVENESNKPAEIATIASPSEFWIPHAPSPGWKKVPAEKIDVSSYVYGDHGSPCPTP